MSIITFVGFSALDEIKGFLMRSAKEIECKLAEYKNLVRYKYNTQIFELTMLEFSAIIMKNKKEIIVIYSANVASQFYGSCGL